MRPTLGIVVCLATYFMATLAVVGQGIVWFNNNWRFGAMSVDTPFFDGRGVHLEGPGYLAQLYFWRTGAGFLPAAGGATPFNTNGYFNGADVVLPGAQECGSAWVQVRAWEAQGGATFEEAALAGAWTGVSNIIFLDWLGSRWPQGCLWRTLSGLQYPGSPLIVRAPESQTVISSNQTTLSVIASSGVLMSYQWFQQPSNRPDGLIFGATNATYTTPPLTNNATFWVSISNSAGTTLSDKATVTVLPAAPHLTLERAAGASVLTLKGAIGFTYGIEYGTNLSVMNWTSLLDITLHTSPFTFIDPGASNSPMRFYRVVAP